ncbi:hypothetical protein PTQ24_000170 [Salmonella phage KKP_3822]|uniref:Uncharacterized protein n=1 Tax=Salmonella phage KKP_3822 TaxID=3027681 RepID=A0AAX4NCY3_9CAUD
MPEFLEPQEFSLVKLFCPILLIKFRFISHNLNSSQSIPHYPQKCSKPVLKHHHRCSFRSSSQNLIGFVLLPKPTQSHTLHHRSHKNLVGCAHLNTCRICTYSSKSSWIASQLRIAGVFRKIHCRICTYKKYFPSDLHTTKNCRIRTCTLARNPWGQMSDLHKSAGQFALPAEMRMIMRIILI